MRDELDARIRQLEAERLRPAPRPLIVVTADEPLAVRIGRLHALDELTDTDQQDNGGHT